MNADEIEIARELVRAEGWRWMAGMAGMEAVVHPSDAWDWLRGATDAGYRCLGATDAGYRCLGAHYYPDLTDAATIGCLAALAREVWGEPSIWCEPENDGTWRVFWDDRDIPVKIAHGDTEGIAWARAIIAGGGNG